MSDAVLDASALLTFLNAEKGAHLVQDLLPRSVIAVTADRAWENLDMDVEIKLIR